MRELIAVLEKIKERTLKAMSTTMEEENSERDHFEEVCLGGGVEDMKRRHWAPTQSVHSFGPASNCLGRGTWNVAELKAVLSSLKPAFWIVWLG